MKSIIKENTTVCSIRIYDGMEISPGHLYMIRPDQLAFLKSEEKKAAFLCTEIDSSLDIEICQDLILISDYVEHSILFNQLNDIFDYYNHWEQNLNKCSNDITGIQEMLNISGPVLNGSIILADYRFNYIAYTPDFESSIGKIKRKYNGQTPSYIVDELLTDPEYMKVQNSHEVFDYPIHNGIGTIPALCCNLFRENEEEYRARLLFASFDSKFTDAQRYLLQFLSEKINEVYNGISDYSLPSPSLMGLREAISNSIRMKPLSSALIAAILKYVHWNFTDQYILLKFVPFFLDHKKELNAVSRNQLELQYSNSCAVLYDDCIILLINLTQNSFSKQQKVLQLDEELSLFLRENLYKVGISAPFDHFTGIYMAYKEADAALQIGNTKDNMFWYYHFTDYALDYMLTKCTEEISVQDLCLPGLVRLMAYDRENGTNYVNVLKIFMDCKYNVTHASKKLYIHRTTLLKHLKKIESLANIDLDDWKIRLHLMLSFQLLES